MMRRTLLAGSLAAVVALGGLLGFWRSSSAGPEKAAPLPEAPAAKAAALPVSEVILYSSGVGYFQRTGKVDGDARVDLSFPAGDVNDLLKSLVVRDLGGGRVTAVAYDSHDPVEKTLQSFALNLNGNPSFAALLEQARGEKVEVSLQQSAASQPGTLTGAILGTEVQKQPAGQGAVADVPVLNLWCAEGLRAVKLADVQRVRFLNPALEGEVRQALEALARGHDAQKKGVSLAFSGAGPREVRVGYVVEAPVWKTSYRLVLNKEGKPFLQGWAVVENPSDEDWQHVGMALVSGRPISFRMDLYDPLYAPRPLVEPELFASLRPPAYEGAMDKPAMPGGGPGAGGFGGAANKPPAQRMLREMARDDNEAEKRRATAFGLQAERLEDAHMPMDLRQGVQSVASAQQLGDSFEYILDEPVSLPRQKSALLPIVNKEVSARRVSIYNPATHPKFPLLGLRFQNSSGLHLMQGPITLFEGSSYAGDSRIPDLQPGEDRLLAYAVDLGTEVEAVNDNPKHTLTKVKAVKGVLYTTTRVVESKTYRAKNRSGQDRTLLVEHPYRADFRLTSKDQPAERARDVYRFELKLPAGQSASETVTEEKDLQSQVVLTNADDNSIRSFLQTDVASAKVKEALRHALELKGKVERTRQELAHAQQQLGDIERDQQRIRANLKETPATAEAYKKYLAKLDSQETEVDKLRDQIKKLQDEQLARQKDYDDFLVALDVE
jgi:hypothetical protein